ncbi:MAG: Mut7-C ubiquitin/RNAse domain-containing protein [Ignavibacteria bacterium]|nr:Mut7-C ubiquitin/RNAse domain-containing protein [Ignavibacteria bacterium]
MNIIYKELKIKFHDELKKFLKKKSNGFIKHIFIDQTTVKDLIEAFGIPHTEVEVILVNKESVDFNYKIKDGDKIEVFPQYKSELHKKAKRLKYKFKGKPKFVADVHLGKLVREMRKLGLDVYYNSNFDDERIVDISNSENRIIITRDLGLLKRKNVKFGIYLKSNHTKEQLKEIFSKYDLAKLINPLTLCLECGTRLKRISKEKAILKLKNHQFEKSMKFYFCTKCEKIYWQGSHYQRMLKSIEKEIPRLRKN